MACGRIRPGIYDYDENYINESYEKSELEEVFDLITEFNCKGQLHGVDMTVDENETAIIIPGIFVSIDFTSDLERNGRLRAFK